MSVVVVVAGTEAEAVFVAVFVFVAVVGADAVAAAGSLRPSARSRPNTLRSKLRMPMREAFQMSWVRCPPPGKRASLARADT